MRRAFNGAVRAERTSQFRRDIPGFVEWLILVTVYIAVHYRQRPALDVLCAYAYRIVVFIILFDNCSGPLSSNEDETNTVYNTMH